VVATPQEWEQILEQQRQAPKQPDPNRRRVRYDVETLLVHVINADYRFACPQKLLDTYAATAGVRMMLSVLVTGSVYFGTGREKGDEYWEKQTFSDSFVLVPNWDLLERPPTKQHGRKYLIISHNYRAE
jgi:NTF2-related export protein 1/2